jgi:nicotinamidase-related amidase
MKKCLIVVDMQNDFITGALGFEKAPSIASRIKDKITRARSEGYDILFTQDTHDEDYLDTVEGKHLPVAHCIKGTKGHALDPSILAVKDPSDPLFTKPTFPSLALGEYLKDANYQVIELCGLVSNICVLSNAVIAKSACPNARISVDATLTSSYDLTLHEKALDILENLHITVKNRG